ncbi:MAG: hypothetical protein CL402_00325 [Acidiferrobacteraceae bacterium]|nr:hypothetical protein [Acidiferrobacteraceae bacterium]|tara:strand:- start:195 stop:458 length:264 start_codon:yes stop_codon:yes gene_type:complete
MDEKSIQIQLLEILEPKLAPFNITPGEVGLDESLLELGILDSMSFLDFIVSLEESFETELDLSEMEPTEFSTIQQLSKLIIKSRNGS